LTSLATKKPQRARWVEEIVRNLILQLVAGSFNSAFEVTSLPAERREHGGFLRRVYETLIPQLAADSFSSASN
jgi:hypothetical protein